MSKPQIMYYHDGRHPHIYRYEPPMYKEEYIAGLSLWRKAGRKAVKI